MVRFVKLLDVLAVVFETMKKVCKSMNTRSFMIQSNSWKTFYNGQKRILGVKIPGQVSLQKFNESVLCLKM